MDEVADIVGLPKLDDTLVHESIADAKTKRDDTVEALHTFDSTQTAQLLPIETSIQSMKEWVKNIEGLFQAGLTDVDFPADTWFAMASRSSLGMAIAAQQVSKSSDPDLEEIYAALAKQAEGIDVSSPSSPGTYSAKEEITYEGMRKVLGGNGSGTPDGLALYAKSVGPSAKYVFDFFTEDIRTILDPEATAVEKAMAIGFTFFKPAKLLDKAGDVAGAARDAGKAVEAVDDVKSTGKAVDKGTGNALKSIRGLDDILDDPSKLKGVKPDELHKYLKDNGYSPQPLSGGSLKGKTFEVGGGFKVNWGGDRILQYHPGSRHHGGVPYWKLSSGKTGTNRYDMQGNFIK